jgi:hypothetical protein
MKTVTEPDSDLPNANVMKTTPLQMFYHLNMPLFPAMLFNPARCNASWQFNFDLESFLDAEKTHVFEQDIQLNEKKCILVLDLSTKIYLDPEKDFSVIRFEKYAHNAIPVPSPQSFSGQDVRITGRTLIYRSDLMDLKNCENGIWIPLKIENTIFNKQNVIEQSIVTVKDVQINKGIPKTFFTEIIPENSFVFDAPNNLTYKQSDHASINSLIKETAKSKRIFIYRYISIISGLALIFIALALKYRAYLKAKRERENRTEEIK